VGFIFQFFNLIPTLNVLDNILLPLKLSKKLTTVSKNFAVELLEEVGLGARVNAMPEKLSGGQQQRVAIVRALVTNPKIVVADEPTGNLDLETADIILDLIFNLAKKHHKTVIIATHDLAIGKRSDQVLLVKNKGIFLN